MTVQCSVVTEGVQCKEVFVTSEPLHTDARFICKNHPRKNQVETNGRIYTSLDERDSEDHFQANQFDKELSGKRGKE